MHGIPEYALPQVELGDTPIVRSMPNVIDFRFEVGERERHTIEYHFNQSSGFGHISVDGAVVKRTFEMFSVATTKRRTFTVGTAEVHEVVIERVRKRMMGGFRPQACHIYVDDHLIPENAMTTHRPGFPI